MQTNRASLKKMAPIDITIDVYADVSKLPPETTAIIPKGLLKDAARLSQMLMDIERQVLDVRRI